MSTPHERLIEAAEDILCAIHDMIGCPDETCWPDNEDSKLEAALAAAKAEQEVKP